MQAHCLTPFHIFHTGNSWQGKGFLRHIKTEHHMWNYYFYYIYLKKKPLTQLTRIDAWVLKCSEKAHLSWFPFFAAICVDDDEDDEQQFREMMIEQRTALNTKLVIVFS